MTSLVVGGLLPVLLSSRHDDPNPMLVDFVIHHLEHSIKNAKAIKLLTVKLWSSSSFTAYGIKSCIGIEKWTTNEAHYHLMTRLPDVVAWS